MRAILLFLLCFVFFVVGLAAGGFMAMIAWAMAACALWMALD